MYVTDNVNSRVYFYDISSGLVPISSSSLLVSGNSLFPYGVSNLGNFMFLVDRGNIQVDVYDISNGLASASQIDVYDVSLQGNFQSGISVDNNYLYFVSNSSTNLIRYDLPEEIGPTVSSYVEFTIKQYTNTDTTIQTVSTLKIPPTQEGALSLDISVVIKNYTDLILPTTDQETQDTYFARVEYQTFLNGVGQGVYVLPDIQVIQAAKQIGDEFGQNMGRYLIQDTPITDLYNLPITMEKLCIYEGYPYYLSANIKGLELSIFDLTVNTNLTGLFDSGTGNYRLPLVSLGTYNFVVFWGDGSYDEITVYNQPEITHEYNTSGIYNIKIIGQISGWGFVNQFDSFKITSIDSLGDLDHINSGAFHLADNFSLEYRRNNHNRFIRFTANF